MIAPTFESLATKYTKPKRIAFAKIDVDKLRDVASQYGVRAMPTFMIFKNGAPIETIQGANPPKLTQAVENAVKMAGPVATAGFSAPGRTLGAGGQRQSLRRPIKWDLNNFVNAIIGFFGLYFVSLFSVSGTDGCVFVLHDLGLTYHCAARPIQGCGDIEIQHCQPSSSSKILGWCWVQREM